MERSVNSEEPENNVFSSAINFTYQGLYRLCEILPMKEFLKCRLICRTWEIFVSNHPRFTKAKTKFQANILSLSEDSLQVARGREIYWRNVHLDFFPFPTKTELISYWRICGMYVTILHLESLSISCIDLVSFLNDCPSVRDVTFENNGFRPRYPRKTLRKIAVLCPHKRLPKKFFPSCDLTSFTSVTFSNQNVIPLCILRYIILRTQGKLEKLKFEHATCDARARSLLEPTKDEIENLLIKVIKENVSSLKTLSVANCRDVTNFLNRIAEIENLSLNELHIDPMHFPSTSRELDKSFGLNLLQSQQPKSVTTLKIGYNEPDSIRLQEILTNYGTKNTLRKLKIIVAKGYNNITPMLCKLENLKDLEIKELGLFRRNLSTDEIPVRGINPNYLTSLPSSLESLTITHSAKGDNFPNLFLQNSKPIFLKHLNIDYTNTNDLMCQLIISSFQMLETLQIRNSRFLTDVGVTGICANTCKHLLALRDEEFDFEFDEKFSISNLKSLRMLSLHGCRLISDISISYGLKLEKLRILDVSFCKHVSESGVFLAVTNNLQLETVILHDIIMSTSSVIDMIAVNKKLRKVRLSKGALLKQRAKYETEVQQAEVSLLNEIFTDEPYCL